MNSKIFIVVDMQKDFVDPNGKLTLYKEGETEKLINNVANAIKSFSGLVICTLDTHTEDSCEFNTFPAHCVKDTQGHELTDKVFASLADRPWTSETAEKTSFTSPTYISQLAEEFPDADFQVAGVCTHICVHDIVTSIVNSYKEAYNRVPSVTIKKELIGDFDQDMAEFALKRLQKLYGVKVE